MRLRTFLFENNVLYRYRPKAPVISVGNLAMGGSGKTPIVIHLARLLLESGFKPAVISRGYGGKARESINVVSDGISLFLDSDLAGDEPRLIAESVPGAAMLTGANRIHPCRHAVEKLGCDVIVLDDGFQHMRVIRDTDIVVFNGSDLYENMHVFPGGLLREPLAALSRADCFLLSGCTENNRHKVERFSQYLGDRYPRKPLFHAQFEPRCFVDTTGAKYSLDYAVSAAVAFCGIASPIRFRNTLEQLPRSIAAFKSFPDHHRYSDADLDNLEKLAAKHQASCLLTTEKDLVKLKDRRWSLPVLALRMEIDVSSSFDKEILARIDSASL